MKTIQIENISLKELEERIQIIIKEAVDKVKLKEMPDDEFLTRLETAELLKVSLVTLHNWAKKKVLIPICLGNRIYYRKVDILKSMKPIYNDNLKEYQS